MYDEMIPHPEEGMFVCLSVCDLDNSKRGVRGPIWAFAPQVKK